MATTIVTKSGSGAPAASDLVAGELAVDLTNKRLYTEDSSAAIIELGTNPSGNVTFGDNGKAIFGAGSDLQIYHDGSNSYVKDAGAGNLKLQGASYVLMESDEGKIMLRGQKNNALQAYYDGSAKLATTATGIDVTGSVTADTYNIGALGSLGSVTTDRLFIATADGLGLQFDKDNNRIVPIGADGSTYNNNVSLGSSGLEFKNLALSGTVTASGIDVSGDINTSGLLKVGANDTEYANNYIRFKPIGASYIDHGTVGQSINFRLSNASSLDKTVMTLSSAGSVGIGESAPSSKLVVGGNGISTLKPTVQITDGNNGASLALRGQSPILFFDATAGGVPKILMDSQGVEFKDGTIDSEGSVAVKIDASGNLLVGGSTAGARLHITEAANKSEADAHFRITGAGYSGYHWLDATAYYIGQNSGARSLRLYSGAETAGVNLAPSGTSWGTFSDERLKYDIEPIENALESLSNLRTVKYRLTDVDAPDSQKKLGLIAQDLVGVLDEVIDPLKRTGDETEYMSVRYTEMVPVLVKAIQEQQATIESLEARIAALES